MARPIVTGKSLGEADNLTRRQIEAKAEEVKAAIQAVENLASAKSALASLARVVKWLIIALWKKGVL